MTGPFRLDPPKTLAGALAESDTRRPLTLPDPGPAAALARAQRLAQGETPATARRVLDLSRKLGYTSDFVRDNLDALSAESAKPGFDPSTFARESPITARWLAANPTRVALLGADYTAMGTWERQIRGIGEGFRQSKRNAELTGLGTAFLSGTLTPEQSARIDVLERETADRPTFGLEGFFEGVLPAMAEQSTVYARMAAAGGKGFTVGAIAGAVVGAVVTKTPQGAAAVGTVGARFGGGVGASTAIAFDMAEQEASGAALDFRRLLDDDGNPLDAELVRGLSLIAGGISGGFELFSFGALKKVVPGLRGTVGREAVRRAMAAPTTRAALITLARNVVAATGTEGVTETLQSMTQQWYRAVAQSESAGETPDGIAFLTDPAMWSEAFASGRVGLQTGGGAAVAAGSVSAALDVRRIRAAQRAHQGIKDLANGLGDSEVAKAAPVEVRELLAEQKAAGVEGFYYAADDWTELWQTVTDADGKPVSDAATAARELLGNADAFDAAQASGGTFFVPLEAWQTLTANPQIRQWATDHARTAPGEMSMVEAGRSEESFTAVLTELLDTAVAAKEESKPVGEVADLVGDRVQRMVRAAGRPQEEARAAGRLWSSAFRAFASSPGTSVDDLLASFRRVSVGPQAATVERASIAEVLDAEEATPEETAAYLANRGGLNLELRAEDRAKADLAAEEESRAGIDAVDASGRLRRNLAAASDASLVAEYVARRDRQVQAESEIDGLEQTPEWMELAQMTPEMREDRRGVELSGGKRVVDVIQAQALTRGAAASRAKGLTRLAAELARRGIDPDQRALEDAADTSFDFGVNDPEYLGAVDAATIAVTMADRAYQAEVTYNASPERIAAARAVWAEAQNALAALVGQMRNQEVALPEMLDVDGTSRPTANSDGRPIHPTGEGVRNFWRWFGDSKVVDADGRPRVVYHGTLRAFSEIRISGKDNYWGSAFYTTSSAVDASDNYADSEGADVRYKIASGDLSPDHDGAVLPLYVKMSNPVVMDWKGNRAGRTMVEGGEVAAFVESFRDEADGTITINAGQSGVLDDFIARSKRGDMSLQGMADELSRSWSDETSVRGVVARAWQAMGYDGIVDASVPETLGSSGLFHGMKRDVTHYLAFDESQVKSAIGNSGEFGPTASILNQEATSDQLSDAEIVRDVTAMLARQQVLLAEADRILNRRGRASSLEQAAGGQGADAMVITHNLSVDKLRHALRLGGIPVPSLAVTGADAPLASFGEITLVGPREMANPKGRFRTRVFGADIYSPRYPTVTFAVDKITATRIRNILKDFGSAEEIRYIGGLDDLLHNAAFKRYAADKSGVPVTGLTYHNEQRIAESLFREVEAPERIFRGFTDSGNRRYIPHTLENVVKILKKDLRGGEGFNYGVGSLRAKFTPEFKSVAQIKKAKGRLLTKANFDKVKAEIDDEFFALAGTLGLSPDQTLEVIEDVPKMGADRAINRAIDDYIRDGSRAEVGQSVAVMHFAAKLRELPTEYFEAKILREVGVEEFAGALVPKDTPQDVREALAARGLVVEDYQGDDRAAALSRLSAALSVGGQDVLFQNADDTDNLRGRIRFSPTREARIELFEKANASTFLHESAHFFLRLMGDLAGAETAGERIKADYAGLMEWLGSDGSAPLTVAQEEQFARGFERYLMEGVAPSAATRSIFYQFATWLYKVYRTLDKLDADLTPEVRNIMGRMLATEQEIKSAEAETNRAPLFPNAAEIMPAAEAARYTQAVAEARAAAEEELRKDTMAVVAREKKAWFTARREEVRAEVEAEVHADPAYRARAILAGGKLPDGTPLVAGDPLLARLDKDALLALVGKDVVKTLPRGVARPKGGLPPDVVAGALGYENGTALVVALAETKPMKAHIDALTEARLVEEYGDPLTDGTLPDRAMAAIHVRQRDKVAVFELEHLFTHNKSALKGILRRIGGRVQPTADVERQAAEMLARRPIKAIRPIEFQRAEAKAAKEAMAAAVNGDVAGAVEAKIRERMALTLTRLALDVREELDDARTLHAKVFGSDEKISASRDMNIVNAARAILARAGIGRSDKTPEKFLEAVTAYDPEMAEVLGAIVGEAVPAVAEVTDLTLDQFRTMQEQVQALWEQALEIRRHEIDGEKMDRAEVVTMLRDRLRALPSSKFAEAKFGNVSPGWDKAYESGAFLARMEFIVNVLDGGDFNGPFRRTFFIPASKVAVTMRAALETHWTTYLGLLEKVGPLTKTPIAATGLSTPDRDGVRRPFQWKSKAHLLGAMLHTGNRTGDGSNRSKLLRGMGWVEGEWDAMVADYQKRGILTEADYDYLQGTWDLFESIKPQMQSVFKKLYGRYFAEITADPIDTPWGTRRGGYVPALRDPTLVEEADARNQARELESGITPESMPTTGKGSTFTRNKSAAPLLMDVRMVGTHLDATMRFIHLEPVVRPLARLIRDRTLASDLDRVFPKAATRLFNPWLTRFASQRLQKRGALSGLDWAANRLRRSASAGMLFGNASNALQNVAGVLPLLASGVKPAHIFAALRTYASGPKNLSAAIAALSPWMDQNKHDTMLDIVRDIRDRIKPPSAIQSVRDFGYANGFVMSKMTQAAMDDIAWQSRFNQATEEGADQANAIEQADSAVRTTQGSRNPEDVAAYAVGTPMYQLGIMLSSWFNVQAGLATSEAAVTLNAVGFKKSIPRLAAIYIYGALLPSILGEAVARVMRGQGIGDSEDKEPWLLDMFQWMAMAHTRYLTAWIPLVGPLVNTAVNTLVTREVYDDRITGSPAVSTLEASFRGVKELTLQALTDEEVNRRDIRDIFTLIALLSDVPVAPLARPVQYLYDVNEGTAKPTGPIDFTRGLLTGASGAPRR